MTVNNIIFLIFKNIIIKQLYIISIQYYHTFIHNFIFRSTELLTQSHKTTPKYFKL